MILVALGIDYKKSPMDVRTSVALDAYNMQAYLRSLHAIDGIEQVMILSTCNRTEIYMALRRLELVDEIINWWRGRIKRLDLSLLDHLVIRQDSHVARHLMNLACGLESMVLGEPQILGQLKEAYHQAQQCRTLGGMLNRLCQKVFSVAKKVRYRTEIGKCPVSVAFSAVSLARQSLDDFDDKTIVIVGAGVTAALVTRHLASCQPQRLIIINRTLEKAQILANSHAGEAFELKAMAQHINSADIIIAAVNASDYLIGGELFFERKDRVFIDLSVPRVIAPTVSDDHRHTLYCVDDIDHVIHNSKTQRQKAAIYAEKLIEKGLSEYIEQEKAVLSDQLIKAMRQQAKTLIESELEKSLKKIENGEDPALVLKRFGHNIKNKWLHTPSVSLRAAAQTGRNDVLGCAEEIFGLKSGNTTQ
ncbi:MAG: glutamyl-tRNA reductase [Francisellaceae bacterium]